MFVSLSGDGSMGISWGKMNALYWKYIIISIIKWATEYEGKSFLKIL